MSESDVYIDVRFWGMKTVHLLKELKYFKGCRPITYVYKWSGTETFMMISNWEHFCSVGVLYCHSITDASQSSYREHRRYYRIEYTSPMYPLPSSMCRPCVWDILTLVYAYLAEWSPTVVLCSAIYRRWFLATKHHEKKIPMAQWLDETWRLLEYVADHSSNF